MMGSTEVLGSIVGAAEYGLGVTGRSSLELLAEASVRALSDAGIPMREVDGLATTGVLSKFNAAVVAEYLGIAPSWYASSYEGGSSFELFLDDAVRAIRAGRATTVLICYGSAQRSAARRSLSSAAPDLEDPLTRYDLPFEPLLPISAYALAAQRHMHQYGTTPEALAEVAVAARRWAQLNPDAYRFEAGELSVGDVLSSPMISSPLHRDDCCLVTDGAAAIVVTSHERARDLRNRPVNVLGVGSAVAHRGVARTMDICRIPAHESSTEALGMAGLEIGDIDVVELYDSFTITVLLTLEALGFCAEGESGEFVADGRLRPGGQRPINTNGGGLSHGHPGMYGLFLLVEAMRQLRNEAGDRQLRRSETAICHGTGGYLNTHGTVVLGIDR